MEDAAYIAKLAEAWMERVRPYLSELEHVINEHCGGNDRAAFMLSLSEPEWVTFLQEAVRRTVWAGRWKERQALIEHLASLTGRTWVETAQVVDDQMMPTPDYVFPRPYGVRMAGLMNRVGFIRTTLDVPLTTPEGVWPDLGLFIMPGYVTKHRPLSEKEFDTWYRNRWVPPYE